MNNKEQEQEQEQVQVQVQEALVIKTIDELEDIAKKSSNLIVTFGGVTGRAKDLLNGALEDDFNNNF